VTAGNNWSWPLLFKVLQCQHMKEKKKSPHHSFRFCDQFVNQLLLCYCFPRTPPLPLLLRVSYATPENTPDWNPAGLQTQQGQHQLNHLSTSRGSGQTLPRQCPPLRRELFLTSARSEDEASGHKLRNPMPSQKNSTGRTHENKYLTLNSMFDFFYKSTPRKKET